jgi:hypothetical protein
MGKARQVGKLLNCNPWERLGEIGKEIVWRGLLVFVFVLVFVFLFSGVLVLLFS